MVFNPEIGKIFDSIFFGVMYFHKPTIIEKVKTWLLDSTLVEGIYSEAADSLPPLPPVLSPFFFPKNTEKCALTLFFQEQIDFQNDTMDSFLRKISVNPSLLYSMLLSSLIPDLLCEEKHPSPFSDPKKYFELVTNAPYPAEFKVQIALLLGSYQHALSVLIEYLQLIFTQIEILHKKHEPEIIAEVGRCNSKESMDLFNKLILQISQKEHKPRQSYFSLSWLNPYILDYVFNNGEDTLILGLGNKEVIDLMLGRSNINFRLMMVALGNETRLAILKVMAEHKEITATDIKNILNLPSSTISGHINILSSHGIISISRKNKAFIYYQINYDFLSRAVKYVNEKILKYLGGDNDA